MKYNELKERARQKAIDWQLKASEKDYSFHDLVRFGEYFQRIGKRYGLLNEFRENGIPC